MVRLAVACSTVLECATQETIARSHVAATLEAIYGDGVQGAKVGFSCSG
jgi:hypothetical protein